MRATGTVFETSLDHLVLTIMVQQEVPSDITAWIWTIPHWIIEACHRLKTGLINFKLVYINVVFLLVLTYCQLFDKRQFPVRNGQK